MNEQWEMCVYSHSNGQVIRTTKYSPQGVTRESKQGTNEGDKLICQFLAEGWEPYQSESVDNAFFIYFRRRIS